MRNLKNNKKSLNEAWTKMIQQTTGVTDTAKLQELASVADHTARTLNENARQAVAFANRFNSLNEAEAGGVIPGGALYNSAPGTVGGVTAPYQTVYNTLGIGNAVPAGRPGLTAADQADGTQMGSGDKWPALLPLALKVAAKTIGYDLVNHTQLNGPTGVLPYMDYVYSGTK
jgi:hypothetical protein